MENLERKRDELEKAIGKRYQYDRVTEVPFDKFTGELESLMNYIEKGKNKAYRNDNLDALWFGSQFLNELRKQYKEVCQDPSGFVYVHCEGKEVAVDEHGDPKKDEKGELVMEEVEEYRPIPVDEVEDLLNGGERIYR